MRDFGIDKGLVQEFQTSDRKTGVGKRFYGFRKMFWTYLNKLNVPFYDACCVEANGNNADDSIANFPVRFNETENIIERFDGTSWIDAELSIQNFTEIGTDIINPNEDSFITVNASTVQNRQGTAINATATATPAQLGGGLITSTSAAAVALTLPTATDFANFIGAARGTSFDFIVDNISGANTVTVTVNTGITAIAGPVITGGATLTVASGTLGQFRLIFTSGTAAKIARLV